jgi:hypothetical protein
MDINKLKGMVFKSQISEEMYGAIRPLDTTPFVEGFPLDIWTPFADDDCGNLFAASGVGHIAFWNHETGKITKLADSIDEFAAHCTKNDDVELKEGQVISTWVNPDFKPEFD